MKKQNLVKSNERYSRHALLRSIGEKGQKSIENSAVFVAGVGALGSLITMLLVRAGVGLVRISDKDFPEIHNLHRQLLYDEIDLLLGKSKGCIAKKKLELSNSRVRVELMDSAIDQGNVHERLKNMDVVVDALDNIETRYLINDTAMYMDIPYVFGGAVDTVGNIMTIIPGQSPCLRCLWPDPEAVREHDTAAEVGVLSSGATTVASMEVTECLKILSGHKDQVLKGLLIMDLWNNSFHITPVERNPNCPCCGELDAG